MDPDDVDITRELIALPTERESVNATVESATEMAAPPEIDPLVGEMSDDHELAEELNEPLDEDKEEEDTGQEDLNHSDEISVLKSSETKYHIDISEELPTPAAVEEEDDTAEPVDVENQDMLTTAEEETLETCNELGSSLSEGRRVSHRIASKKLLLERTPHHVYKLSVKKALRKNEVVARESILKELRQMVEKEVWEVLDKTKLSNAQLKKAIRSTMFLTEKFTAAGDFDKLKARLVAGGDGQDKSLYGNLSSPTVAQETVMLVIAIAAVEGRRVTTIDITGAYLECDMKESEDDEDVLMIIDPFLASLLATLDPVVVQKKDERGNIYVRLKKALYGCVQSAKLWYNKLCRVLKADGYVRNDYDECLFNKTTSGVQCTVAFHVDDLLITCEDQGMIDDLERMLKSSFAAITVNKGRKHSYLSMNMEIGHDSIALDMGAYVKKCLEGREDTRMASSPATDSLFEVSEDGVPLIGEEKKRFHSDVAKLLYLAKRTRGQILPAISYLSGRVNHPTDDDVKKLDRVFAYLYSTVGEKVVFRRGGAVKPEVFIDASYGVHDDGTSRTGVVIMVGGAAVGCWSSKQKIVTKSSTEAELVGLSDGLTFALWMRELVIDQGYALEPTKVYQDNMGVIKIINSGRSPKHRTRHLNVRHFFARDRVKSGDISLEYKPTNEMIADIMTKPVNGFLFLKLGRLLSGHPGESEEGID